MKKLLLSIAVLLFGATAFAQNIDNLFHSYLKVKNALVLSDSKASNLAIASLYETIKKEGDPSPKSNLLKATEKLNNVGGDIYKQRALFNEVSTSMWEIVKKGSKTETTVYYQYCPMKKAYWLSDKKEIQNPYYGSSMLSCGKIEETK